MIQVRKSTYRRVDGWLICGRPAGQTGGWGVKIFARYEDTARKIKAAVVAGDGDQVSRLLMSERP